MATETYKYFIADSNLRAAYGGASIQAFGDTAETTKETLCMRYVCEQLSLPKDYTQYLFQIGTASSVTYIRVPDNLYTGISAYLSTAELASVVSSAPSGFALASTYAQFQPRAKGVTVTLRGDSISDALGITGNNKALIFAAQAIDSIAGETLIALDTGVNRELISSNYKLTNISLGGSNWANTVDTGEQQNAYPLNESLAYPQRTQTLPLNGNATNNVFVYWLGTNDLSYDLTITGADCWSRASTRITALRAQFPDIKIILCTTIKRSENAALNSRINDYNVLMRANYASVGVDALADFEAEVSVVNISTGDTTNTTYYTDGVHITETTHALLAPVFLTALNSVMA